MDVQPGWYVAGVPGRERWWDGYAWTAHERDAPAPAPVVQPVAPAAPLAQAAPMTSAPTLPAPGWYQVPGSDLLRWWEGRYWTGFRIKNGRPGTDGVTVEQPVMAWVLGGMFVLLGGMQFLLSLSGGVYIGAGIPFIVLGALWFAIAVRTAALRRTPAPATAPAFPDVVRPLPGEQEGPSAGWYPVTKAATRWWTGARWAQYIATRNGIRPTFHGHRAIVAMRVVVWGILGLALLGVIGGIVLMAVAPGDAALTFVGAAMLIFGIVFVLLWVVLFLSGRMQERLLRIPAGPPAMQG